jgi:hypothetical protein
MSSKSQKRKERRERRKAAAANTAPPSAPAPSAPPTGQAPTAPSSAIPGPGPAARGAAGHGFPSSFRQPASWQWIVLFGSACVSIAVASLLFAYAEEMHEFLYVGLAIYCAVNGCFYLWFLREWDESKFLVKFLRELAMALLISSVLIVAVERVSHSAHEKYNHAVMGKIAENNSKNLAIIEGNHKDHRARIARDVFEYALGYKIDQEVMDEVKAGVFEVKLIREDWEVKYSFKKGGDYLRVNANVRYKVRNQSTSEQKYALPHYFTVSDSQKAFKDDGFLFLVVEDLANREFVRALTTTGRVDPLETKTIMGIRPGTKERKSLEKMVIKLTQARDKGNTVVIGNVPELFVTGDVTSVTFTFNGSAASVSVPYTGVAATDAAAIQAALEGLSTVKPNPVTVVPNGAGRFLISSAVFSGTSVPILPTVTGSGTAYSQTEILIRPGNEIAVTYEYTKTMRREDMITFVTTHPTKAMTITVGCDDPRIKFLLDTSHRVSPGNPGPKHAGPIPQEDDLGGWEKQDPKQIPHCFWKLPAALLPGHGIILRWWPSE